MSGHSKWATTKHKKAVIDAKRGKLFAKLIKNIEVAARTGGGDPDGNPTLYDAIQKARKSSVPIDNIDRAVKRGSGAEAGGADWQTIMYEGYGPNGVAVLIECLTDNKNRAAAEVRVAMSRNGGTMADPGSVAYNFTRKGVVSIEKTDGVDEDSILEAVLDAGATSPGLPAGDATRRRSRRGKARRPERREGAGADRAAHANPDCPIPTDALWRPRTCSASWWLARFFSFASTSMSVQTRCAATQSFTARFHIMSECARSSRDVAPAAARAS